MTDPGDSSKKIGIEAVLAQFDELEPKLGDFCLKTSSLIEASLQDASIRYHSVQSRVKDRKKLREKYLDPAKNYQELSDITDLAGLRIITYYEDDVDRVAEVIKREFEVDSKNSVDLRKTEPDRFSYSALHFVCSHLEKRKTDVEYKKFGDVQGEIQITSILRHAWSEIEHEWYDLKDGYPPHVKKRFSRLAALLDLAESEFLDIRKVRAEYERSVAVRVEANVPDLAVDKVSIKTFISQEPIVLEIDAALATLRNRPVSSELSDLQAELRASDAVYIGFTTLQILRDALKKYRVELPEFADRCLNEVWPRSGVAGSFPKGHSIFYLALFLMSIKGRDALSTYIKDLYKISEPDFDLDLQVAIATEVKSKQK